MWFASRPFNHIVDAWASPLNFHVCPLPFLSGNEASIDGPVHGPAETGVIDGHGSRRASPPRRCRRAATTNDRGGLRHGLEIRLTGIDRPAGKVSLKKRGLVRDHVLDAGTALTGNDVDKPVHHQKRIPARYHFLMRWMSIVCGRFLVAGCPSMRGSPSLVALGDGKPAMTRDVRPKALDAPQLSWSVLALSPPTRRQSHARTGGSGLAGGPDHDFSPSATSRITPVLAAICARFRRLRGPPGEPPRQSTTPSPI